MANTNQELLNATMPYDGYVVNPANNSFISMWCDKRSASEYSVSAGFICTDGYYPDGYFHLETSNAPENKRSTYGGGPWVPAPGVAPYDAQPVLTTYQAPQASPISPTVYFARWELIYASARWVRVVYVPNTNVPGLQAFVWINCPLLSA